MIPKISDDISWHLMVLITSRSFPSSQRLSKPFVALFQWLSMLSRISKSTEFCQILQVQSTSLTPTTPEPQISQSGRPPPNQFFLIKTLFETRQKPSVWSSDSSAQAAQLRQPLQNPRFPKVAGQPQSSFFN